MHKTILVFNFIIISMDNLSFLKFNFVDALDIVLVGLLTLFLQTS